MVICGQCEKEFSNSPGYLNHKCEVTGVKPTEPRSMGKHHELLSEKALARGNARKNKKK